MGVAPVTININTFVDTVLEKIQRVASQRSITLLSFTPEICILLKLKQKAYPVMFMSNAGKAPQADGDLRAASLEMGVRFAKRWNLDGIVLACEALIQCPRLIRFVQNAGLACASRGVPNNDPANTRVSFFFFFHNSFHFDDSLTQACSNQCTQANIKIGSSTRGNRHGHCRQGKVYCGGTTQGRIQETQVAGLEPRRRTWM